MAGIDGQLHEAAQPNANIRDYKSSPAYSYGQPGEKTTTLDRVDTTVQDRLSPDEIGVPIRIEFLPPGSTYHLSLFAEDSSGYPSLVDTLNVTTSKVTFADTDSI